jgi:Dockerin type I domain
MGKTVMYTLMFLCLTITGAWGQFPPAGADTYGGNNGNMLIEVFSISPMENVSLSGGPVIVQRSGATDPGDGRDEIQTEIVAMNLTGAAPIAGPMVVNLNPSPTTPSKGMIKADASGSDFPAESFFDVFVDISLTALGLDLTNQIPIHITKPGLTSIPWPGETHASSSQQIDLYDPVGTLKGRLYYFDWTPTLCPPGPPFCDSVQTDACLLICPKSDMVFKVLVKDSCGNPICDPATWLDFSQCPAQPCSGEEPLWPKVFPDSCDPATGIHYFTVDASLLDCTVCQVGLFVHDKFCRYIPAHFFDINNDKCVTQADFVAGALCNDYDCNGVVDAVDFSIFSSHLSHCCPAQPCPPGPAFCDSTITDPCLLICPKSDLVYKVTLKDSCGNPVCAPSSLWLDFAQCPGQPCPNEEPNWPRVFPDSCHAATGEHFFTVDASELDCFDCSAGLFVNGALCRVVKARFFDINGDGCVTTLDFIGGPCNDYDCDGQISSNDRLIFDSHLGHCCKCDCRPGDANGSGTINIQDITYLVNYLYKSGPAPLPYLLCAGDANCDCKVNIQDITFLINRLYKNGPAPCTCEEWILKCGTPLRN